MKEAPRYCHTSYRNFLFDNDKNTLICYELNSKLWDYKHTDDSNIEIISGYKDKILIYSESGDLFALDIWTGKFCWEFAEQCPYGQYSYYGDFIYHIYKNELREINAGTGSLNRVMDIKNLREQEHFFATGGIKSNEDLILAKDVDGAIVIIDRKTLAIKDILRFEKHLINNQDSLQWVNNRLFVQDVEKTIHIFE